jgi:hypothetical protein
VVSILRCILIDRVLIVHIIAPIVQILIVDISIFSLIFGTVMLDFTQVYSFLASIFDPSTCGHLQKLKDMNPIDVEMVCDHGCASFSLIHKS